MGITKGNYDKEDLAVISGAMVYCDCAPKLSSDDVNSMANNELYRELVVNEECPHGVYCEDEPLLHEGDCKPFINLKPFECCRSNNYINAMEGIVENLKGKSGKFAEYAGYLQEAKEQYANPVENGRYACVLEVLDRWFDVDDKHSVSNYFNVSAKINKSLLSLEYRLTSMLKRVRKEFEKTLPDFFERFMAGVAEGFGPSNGRQDSSIEFVQIKDGGILDRLNKSINKYSELKAFKENALKEFDQDRYLLLTNLENMIELLKSNIFFNNSAKGDFKESASLQNYKNQFIELIDSFKEIIDNKCIKTNKTDEYIQLSTQLNNIEYNINSWLDDNENLMESVFEYHTLLTDSFLVCRCGGIITIKRSGQEQRDLIYKLEDNLRDLLKYAEKHIYEQIERVYTYKHYGDKYLEASINKDKVIFISAFNLVHSILLSMGGDGISPYDYNHDPIYENSEYKGAGALVNIRPYSEVHRDVHDRKIIEGLSTEIPIAGIVFAYSFGLRDIMEDNASVGSILGLISGAYEVEKAKITNTFIKFFGKLATKLTHVVTWINILNDACATTQLNHTAEITLTIVTSFLNFKYVASYDMEGQLIEIIPTEFNDGNLRYRKDTSAKQYFDKEEISYIVYQNGDFMKGTETKHVGN